PQDPARSAREPRRDSDQSATVARAFKGDGSNVPDHPAACRLPYPTSAARPTADPARLRPYEKTFRRVSWTPFSTPRPAGRGPLAQLAEQRTFNPRVVGSSPTGPTFSTVTRCRAVSLTLERGEVASGAHRRPVPTDRGELDRRVLGHRRRRRHPFRERAVG